MNTSLQAQPTLAEWIGSFAIPANLSRVDCKAQPTPAEWIASLAELSRVDYKLSRTQPSCLQAQLASVDMYESSFGLSPVSAELFESSSGLSRVV